MPQDKEVNNFFFLVGLWSSCISIPSAGIASVYHHAQLQTEFQREERSPEWTGGGGHCTCAERLWSWLFVGHQEVTRVKPTDTTTWSLVLGWALSQHWIWGVGFVNFFFSVLGLEPGASNRLHPQCLAPVSAISVSVDPGSRLYDSS